MVADCGTNAAPKHGTYLPLVGEVDGRTRSALAFKAAVADFVSDLGGDQAISRAQLELARRAAGLAVLAAQHEADIVGGNEVDAERYVTLANAQGRVLTRLGLKRRARDITPDLRTYIEDRHVEVENSERVVR